MCEYVLPQLPPKAKPRLDHHGFREGGNKAGEDRIKKLSSAINSFKETEERYKAKKEQLSSSASKDRNDARVTRKYVTEDLGNITRHKYLVDRVVKQFGITDAELQHMLKQLESKGHAQKARGLLTDISSGDTRARQKEMKYNLEMRQLTEKKDKLESKLKNLEIKALGEAKPLSPKNKTQSAINPTKQGHNMRLRPPNMSCKITNQELEAVS